MSASTTCDSPQVVPTTTPTRSEFTGAPSSVASSNASRAAAAANSVERPHFPVFSRRSIRSGRNARTSPAQTCGNPVVSKLEIGEMPDRAWESAWANADAPMPMLDTGPTPVITTRGIH